MRESQPRERTYSRTVDPPCDCVEGRNGAPGSRYEGTGYEDRSFVLNKVFEVRNPITGATGEYVGVEGRVVWGEDAQARRQR